MKIYNFLKVTNKEGSRLFYVASVFFLLLLGIAFGRISRDSIFIQEVGAGQLPFIYVLNAILMIVITGFYTKVYGFFSRGSFLIGLVVVSSLIGIGLHFMVQQAEPYVYYVLYVVSEAIILILPLHFWTFANEVFDPREGKRVFPLLGSAGLAGTIVGGVLTGVFAGDIGTINLLFVWSGIMLLKVPILLRFRIVFGRISATGRGQADTDGMLSNLSVVLSIPLVRTLAYMAVPMWMTVYLIDFQFFLAIEEAFFNQNDTSVALGIIGGITSGVGLLFQLVLTGPLLAKLGISRSVLVFPGGMILGTLALIGRLFVPIGAGIFNPRLWTAVFARMTDESVLPAIGETSFQLLYNSIADEWRGRARAFVSGVTEPTSVALAGLFLIGFATLDLPEVLLPFISLLTALIWFRFALRIGGHYMDALVGNLSSHNIDLQGHALTELAGRQDSRATQMLEASLFSEDEGVSMMAVGILTGSHDKKALLSLAYDIDKIPLTSVKIEALNQLADGNVKECWPMILPFLHVTDNEVRAAAVRAIGLLGGEDAIVTLEKFMYDNDLAVKIEAVTFQLRIRKRLDERNAAVKELRKIIRSRKPEIQMLAPRMIEQSGKKQLRPELIRLARSKHIVVSREAIRALGLLGDWQDIHFLVKFLDDYKRQLYAAEAIERVGEAAVVPLLEIMKTQTDEGKQNLLDCLGKIGDGMAVPALTAMLSGQTIEVENKALEALTRIHFKQIEKDPEQGLFDEWMTEPVLAVIHQRMAELIDALRTRADFINRVSHLVESDARWLLLDALKRSYTRSETAALLCLELLADPAAIRAASAGLHSGESRARAEAVELIEGSCPEGNELAGILEKVYFPTKSPRPKTAEPETKIADMLATQLLWKEKPWLYAAILFVIGEFQLLSLKATVKELTHHSNKLVKHNALIALQKLGAKLNKKQKKEAALMAINMERMLFLRSVPLFSEVDGDDIYWINEITREANFSANDIIFRENDKGDALYIIVSGSVRIIKEGKKRLILDVFSKRDCFGEMAILDQEPRSATTQAAEDTRLLVILRDDFQRLLLARPQIGFSLFRTLSLRIRQLGARLKEAEEKQEAS